MGRVKHGSKTHRSNGDHKINGKTKRRTRDFDQIVNDMKSENYEKTLQQMTEFDEDKPGLGKYYCVACAKYFINEQILKEHFETKRHKRKLKQIAVEKPWTIQDSLGMKIDYGKKQSEISMDITSQTNISKEKSLFSQLEQ